MSDSHNQRETLRPARRASKSRETEQIVRGAIRGARKSGLHIHAIRVLPTGEIILTEAASLPQTTGARDAGEVCEARLAGIQWGRSK